MTYSFNIDYRAEYGDVLLLLVDGDAALRMSCSDGHTWTAEVSRRTTAPLTYHYAVEREGHIIRREWCASRHHTPRVPLRGKRTVLYDRWQSMPEDTYLYSSAFTECWNRRALSPTDAAGAVTIRVRAPQLRGAWRLALAGLDGDWQPQHAVHMAEEDRGVWTATITPAAQQLEFKFIAIECGAASCDVAQPLWETSGNRHITLPALGRTENVCYELDQAFFAIPDERVAGTLVPLFSLRTKGSYGVGDFGDLVALLDFAAATGQRLVQLLPINDTTATGTWRDSYPYSCVSTCALHPQYIDLRQLPALHDEAARDRFIALQHTLNAKPVVDYEAVNRAKGEYLALLFKQEGRAVLGSKAFKTWFEAEQQWLVPYARWCTLRDLYGTPDCSQWRAHTSWDERERPALCDPRTAVFKKAALVYYTQYVAAMQMQAAHRHARQLGIVLKGDIPIGAARHGSDAWQCPQYFNLDSQTGAPPDDFAAAGQTWGFPTYNWDALIADDCQWWVRRFQNMAKYFDAYRIDHVLGFFRIWEIPAAASNGLMGHFAPALPMTRQEIESFGFRMAKADAVIAGADDLSNEDVLFIRDRREPTLLHPRIAAQTTHAYATLTPDQQQAYNALYDHYCYHRHNGFWKREALKRLPPVVNATSMLCCAEDLGMVPACVAPVMNALRILSLEIQTMPKGSGRFGDVWHYPYRSVTVITSHDMAPLRQWWDEDRERTDDYWHTVLGRDGAAPHPMPASVAEQVVMMHLRCPAMVCVIAVQDWLATCDRLRLPDPNAERVNVPANPNHYWCYRMHLNIDDLARDQAFVAAIKGMVAEAGRV